MGEAAREPETMDIPSAHRSREPSPTGSTSALPLGVCPCSTTPLSCQENHYPGSTILRGDVRLGVKTPAGSPARKPVSPRGPLGGPQEEGGQERTLTGSLPGAQDNEHEPADTYDSPRLTRVSRCRPRRGEGPQQWAALPPQTFQGSPWTVILAGAGGSGPGA